MSNALEMTVRRVAKTLHENQVARLYKIPNDIKLAGKKLIYGEQQPSDFWGYTAQGRVILIECKICGKESLPIGTRGIKPHQLSALMEVHKAGGLGLLVWMHDSMIAVIDYDQVHAYSLGRKSIPWSNIPLRFKHEPGLDPLHFFWPFLCASGSPVG